MTDTEIEAYRNRLNELTDKCSNGEQEKKICSQLQDLARKVGASRLSVCVFSEGAQIKDADTSILIHNIHQALQTASMVNMCRTATQGYEIATEASNRAVKVSKSALKQSWIIAVIAFLSAVAAWVAAMRT